MRAARLRAIEEDIVGSLARGEAVSVDEIAAEGHRVTPRYVQMLFDEEGTTFTDLRQRLVRAHRMLSDPRYAGQKIAALAYEVGFNDRSYFVGASVGNTAWRRPRCALPHETPATRRNRQSSKTRDAEPHSGSAPISRTSSFAGAGPYHTTSKSVLLSASPLARLANRVEPPAAFPFELKNSWPVALL